MHFVKNISTDLKSAWNSAFFDILFDFEKIGFMVIFVLFQTLKQKAPKTAPKIKNLLSLCVLDSNFAPIKGSVILIF